MNRKGDTFVSSAASYPVINEIVFMGYDASRSKEMKEILLDSRKHQGVEESFQAALEYSKFSYPLIFKTFRTWEKIYSPRTVQGNIALNVGGGGDPSTNELAALGYHTYLIDLEPNSVFLQKIWDRYLFNSNINRICCDCSSLPFPDQSVDMLFCKEFLHHTKEYSQVLNEFNRVLKIGGQAIIIEPTLTWRTSPETTTFPGHYYQTAVSYYKAFISNHFEIERYYLYFTLRTATMKNRMIHPIYRHFNEQFENAKRSNTVLKLIIQKILDGHNIWFLRKKSNCSTYSNTLKNIEVIDPSFLTFDSRIYENSIIKNSVEYYLEMKNRVHPRNE